jgi:NADH dehydrogenase [ubiquinone] 1 alpha subcomplex assembly factor 7
MTERLDAFMARANAAYYATHDPFADFTTAPEISQVFGEILGLWAAVAWDLLRRPSPVLLAEAGPGRGTLMADALRAVGRVAPAFRDALRLHLIETSPRLRAIQAHALPEAVWHDRLDQLPEGPLLLLGNEFLDALPIRQFVRRGVAWAERYVSLAGPMELAEPVVPSLVRRWEADAVADGTVIELSEPALAIATALGNRFARQPGAALFLDYGPEHSAPGDSLQAIAGGQPVDPCSPAGNADLTAHVDFAALAGAAREAGAAVQGPVPQGMFLARLGLFQRTNRLARHLPPARASALMQAAQRLAEPDRMGRLFKALTISSPGCPALPGFEG